MEEAAMPYEPDVPDEAWARVESRLLAIEGVNGVIQRGDYIHVLVQDESARANVPSEVAGRPVSVEVVGEIRAQ